MFSGINKKAKIICIILIKSLNSMLMKLNVIDIKIVNKNKNLLNETL